MPNVIKNMEPANRAENTADTNETAIPAAKRHTATVTPISRRNSSLEIIALKRSPHATEPSSNPDRKPIIPSDAPNEHAKTRVLTRQI